MASPLFERSNESKIKNSKDRGLRPLLRFIAKLLNRGIIDKIDDHFYLDFVGLDELTEDQRLEMRKSQISTFKTVNEIRREEGLQDLEYGGDTILNPIFSQRQAMAESKVEQQQQMQMQQEQQAQQPQQEQPQQEQTQTGERDASGKEIQDPTGAIATAQHSELETSGAPDKDKRIPRGKDNNIIDSF